MRASEVLKMFKVHIAALIVGLMAMCAFAVSAQNTDDLQRRIGNLEDVRTDARITAVEARLDNIENINIGIFGGVLVQLILTAAYHKQNRSDIQRRY